MSQLQGLEQMLALMGGFENRFGDGKLDGLALLPCWLGTVPSGSPSAALRLPADEQWASLPAAGDAVVAFDEEHVGSQTDFLPGRISPRSGRFLLPVPSTVVKSTCLS
jgi:hypothetical protein